MQIIAKNLCISIKMANRRQNTSLIYYRILLIIVVIKQFIIIIIRKIRMKKNNNDFVGITFAEWMFALIMGVCIGFLVYFILETFNK